MHNYEVRCREVRAGPRCVPCTCVAKRSEHSVSPRCACSGERARSMSL